MTVAPSPPALRTEPETVPPRTPEENRSREIMMEALSDRIAQKAAEAAEAAKAA